MSKKINDGGMAFPGFEYSGGNGSAKHPEIPAWENYQVGMSLRDYFAAKALEGCIANATHWDGQGDAETFAKHSYQIADAMIAEREKQNL